MSRDPTVTLRGNARNNYLYGTATHDGIEGGLGNDYLRGYAGFDYLWGGAGSDRFVFERTQAQNGIDTIMDYMYAPTVSGGEVDVLDFSLVGFARNALSRNGGTVDGIDNVVRFVADDEGGGARVEVSLTGAGGQTFTQWATLEGLYAGNLVHFSIGAHTYTRPVQGALSTGLRYDIGNDDRNGDGEPDAADNDDLFDDRLLVSDGEVGARGAEVLIGDRVRGFGGTTAFTPGVTALSVPESVVGGGEWTDAVWNGEFQVYYGTYDAATDIFTVTSTPGTTADPTSATHTMVLYDSDGHTEEDGRVDALGGKVLQGVYAESQWYIDNGALKYDTDGFFASQEMSVLDAENVLYGTSADEFFDGGDGIDIIYAGQGTDFLFGGSSYNNMGRDMGPGPDGNDWLYGGGGADAFFATNVVDGGIDSIKDFSDNGGVANGSDVIVLAQDPWVIQQIFDLMGIGNPNQIIGWQPVNLADIQESGQGGLLNIGNLTADPAGASLHDAMVLANGEHWGTPEETTTPYNVYRFRYDGKEYLFWDAAGDGYAAEVQGGVSLYGSDNVIVEITGAVGLNASNIYLNAGFAFT